MIPDESRAASFSGRKGCDENLRKEKFSEAASCLASGIPLELSFGHMECIHGGC